MSPGKVTIKLVEDLIQTNYNTDKLNQYRIEFVDSKGIPVYAFNSSNSNDIEVSWLKNELATIRVYVGTTLLVETCHIVLPDTYDPETLDFPIEKDDDILGADSDNDGILDQFDNCPHTPNPKSIGY